MCTAIYGKKCLEFFLVYLEFCFVLVIRDLDAYFSIGILSCLLCTRVNLLTAPIHYFYWREPPEALRDHQLEDTAM